MPAKGESGRLLHTVKPSHYDLNYKNVDFNGYSFTGTCTMHCTALCSTHVIQLNVLDLQIFQARLKDTQTNTSVAPTTLKYNMTKQTVDLEFEEALQVDQDYILTMDFCGELNNQMHGFYRSYYLDIHGQQKIMGTTQFEACDARRAFPCLDEPAWKATFQLTITIPRNLQCISNAPPASTYSKVIHDQSMQTITFQKTPLMCTYLVAWIIGEFDGISTTSNGIVTTVYTTPGKAQSAQFCLNVASRSLDLYQELFHVPYPLTKSDLLAIPDFAAGAMENWGAVTYREAKILVNKDTSESVKRGIARTVCHELSHQWFGNLVSVEYWTQLYLKEGMARFMEFVGIDRLFPEWDAWTEFVQSVYGLALNLDSLKSSHPIEVEVNHPDEISEIYDSISYAKGASVIRMIASYIGMDAFWLGMKIYLTRHAYSNTVTKDLWMALEESSNLPVVKFMESWTLEMNYPILLLTAEGNLTVERYLATGTEPGLSSDAPWPIPVTARVEGSDELYGPWVINGPDGDETPTLTAKLKEWVAASKWFKLNIDQTGFFRVSYSKDQFERLARVMEPQSGSVLSAADRLGLISDSFAAGKAGYASISDSLTLIEGYGEHDKTEYAVWQELSENVSALAALVRSESFYPKLQDFMRKLYGKQKNVLGWHPQEQESGRVGTLRSTVIGMLGIAGDPVVLKEAYDLFMAYRADPAGTPISGDLRKTVFRCALRHDEATVFAALKEMFEASSFPEDQRNCLSVMGCVTDASRHAQMIDYVYNSGRVRLQDISFSLSSLSGTTDEGGRQMWQYFKDNFQQLRTKCAGGMWSSCIALSCRGLSTTVEVDEVEAFFSDPAHPAGSGARRLQQTLEVLRTKIMRRERDRQSLETYFLGKN